MSSIITESYLRVRTEVTANWKTGAVMTGVAVVVGGVYGKAAAAGVVFITVSNYQIIGRQIKVISWMSLRKFLLVAVMFGNNHYFNVINPQIMSSLAVSLVLIDNFQISSINLDLSSQNETVLQNEDKLKDVKELLEKVEQSLRTLDQSVAEAEAAKAGNAKKAQELSETIPSTIVTDLENVHTLIVTLKESPELQEFFASEKTLQAYKSSLNETNDQYHLLLPIMSQAGAKMHEAASSLEKTVCRSQQQIGDLTSIINGLTGSKNRGVVGV